MHRLTINSEIAIIATQSINNEFIYCILLINLLSAKQRSYSSTIIVNPPFERMYIIETSVSRDEILCSALPLEPK